MSGRRRSTTGLVGTSAQARPYPSGPGRRGIVPPVRRPVSVHYVTARARPPAAEPGPDGRQPPAGAGSAATAAPPSAVTPAELTERAWRRWRSALDADPGDSALSDVDRLRDALLDLSAAHPSGIAQLFAGRPTRLSNLVREGAALSTAKRRIRAVADRADDYAQRYGLAPAFLAIGVATWTEQDDAVAEQDDAGTTQDHGGTGEHDAGTAPDDAVAQVDAAGEGKAGSEQEEATESADADGDAAPQEAGPRPDARGPATGDTADPAPVDAPRRRTIRAPVLLRPVSIRSRRGDSDHDLALEPALEINPVLASALRSRGALLDPAGLARGAFSPTGFDPRPAIDRVRALGAATLPDFSLEDRLLVGTFVHPEQSILDDLDALAESMADHEVISALAGDRRSIDALAHPLPPMLRGDRPPDEERGVVDLDPTQTYVLDVVAAGHHLLVDAPPGSDVAGTLAAVVADAAAAGRTVLYVAGHRRSADALTARLADLGLDESVIDVAPESGWREQAGQRLLGAMTVDPVSLDADQLATVERELLNRRGRLQRYVAALHRAREPWGSSAYDALQALARLTSARPLPQTRVRLTRPAAEALTAEHRTQAATDLVRAARLGAFAPTTSSSAWFGADLPTPDRARAAVDRAERLQRALPQVHDDAVRVAGSTGLTPAATPEEWAEQLRMLAGIRGALDLFRPIVFERSAADLIAATGSRAWREEHGVEMSGALRRRLRRQAKDMVRPGRPVPDLHAALLEVQAQREIWRAHCPAGGWPRVPEGLAAIEQDHQEVRADLGALSTVLVGAVPGAPAGTDLARLPWADVEARLARLLADRSALETLPERTALLRSLDQRGLGELLADLTERRVGVEVVAAELDLAWWTTVFEEILIEDPALAEHDGPTLTRLVAEFRALDRRFIEDRARLARAAARAATQARMKAADGQTQELFGEIVQGSFTTLRNAVERFPRIARQLRPCLVAAPMLVPHLLPPTRTEDLVIIDAAGHLPTEMVVPAIARGTQVLVVGDTRCAVGSALEELTEVLPVVALSASASRHDPYLTAFLAEHGYGRRLTPTPLPTAAGLVRLELVDGTGMPGPDGQVEGTAEEVARVVDLVTEHVLTRPEESLAVVTPSRVHAERVREAVQALVPDSPTLARFVDQTPESFVVVELGATQGLSREAIILSVGYGRTPHGRVLHRFGMLGEAEGGIRLLQALGSSRHRLTVVSCFRADELDRTRMHAPGSQLLVDLLELAARRTDPAGDSQRSAPTAGTDPDRLVLDLAERLWRMGLLVDVDHGITSGTRIPLVVGHPDLPDQMLVAVLTDDAAYVHEPSVRVRDRQVPERLERLGWSVVQVWSAAAFLDPQAEAEAICAATLRRLAERRRDEGGTTTPLTVPDVTDPRGEPEPDDGEPVAEPEPDDEPPPDGEPVADPDPQPDDEPPPGREPVAEEQDSHAEPESTPPHVLGEPLLHIRGPRPDVEPGLRINGYSDDQLDEVAAWLISDGLPRAESELIAELRDELALERRGARVDTALRAAARRALATEPATPEPATPEPGPARIADDPVLPRSSDESDHGWGEPDSDDDDRLRREVPPHW